VWNLAQLATALIQQMDDKEAAIEEATEIVHAMPPLIQRHWRKRFGQKIGIVDATEADMDLVSALLSMMAEQKADFTNTFSALASGTARDQFTDRGAYDAWGVTWKARLSQEKDPQPVMAQANPVLIPRNHRIEHMIEAAVQGDMQPFERLSEALKTPFTETDAELSNPPSPSEVVPATFCGT
jgi:uncharacterized protein YdiU (UPF0061 family)